MLRIWFLIITFPMICLASPIFAQDSGETPKPAQDDPELSAWSPSQSPIPDPLHDVFFHGDQLGWAYTYGTGLLIHTEDGGENWAVLYQFPGHESEYYFEQIQFLNPNDGYIVGDYGYVYRTRDGGRSWKDVSPQIPGRMKSSSGKKGYRVLYYGMRFNTWKDGFLSGLKYKYQESAFPQVLTPTTSDGGFSWHQSAKPQPAMMLSMAFLNDRKGYAGSKDGIWKTENNGRSWTRSFTDNHVLGAGQIRDIHILNQQTIVASGFKGVILRTENGGGVWQTTAVVGGRLRSLTFRDQTHGFAAGDKNQEGGVLYASDDAGRTWRMLPFDLPDLHRLTLSPSKVWAVGKEGTIISRSRF